MLELNASSQHHSYCPVASGLLLQLLHATCATLKPRILRHPNRSTQQASFGPSKPILSTPLPRAYRKPRVQLAQPTHISSTIRIRAHGTALTLLILLRLHLPRQCQPTQTMLDQRQVPSAHRFHHTPFLSPGLGRTNSSTTVTLTSLRPTNPRRHRAMATPQNLLFHQIQAPGTTL